MEKETILKFVIDLFDKIQNSEIQTEEEFTNSYTGEEKALLFPFYILYLKVCNDRE